MRKDDITNIAVYFNDEYIGEASYFKVEKGTNKFMPILKIKGDFQYKE